ncbi:MAG: glutamate-cysteine ligase family protein [Promethearchaeota archaeon]
MTARSLRFTIGYEMEVQIVNRDGSLLVGSRMKPTWNELLARATKKLAATPKSPDCPKIVHDRFKGAKLRQIEKAEKRFSNVGVSYLLDSKNKPLVIDSFGPDPNLSQITWILELVTPPCQTMEELQFWCSHLYDVALQSLPPKKFSIISTGFNPLEKEYRSGLTFGDHIHIGGFLNDRERIKAYNLVRNFVPHLIALSANSPFIDGGPSNVPKISEKDHKIRILGGKCAKSLRLIHNKSQLGPCDVERYIPYLKRPNPADFDKIVGRGYPDNRMVDIFPFTRWNTIELRFFDCQLSNAQRMAIVSILQAICLKANRLGQIPEVSTKIILDNRDKAVEFGLLGTFLNDKALENPAFEKIYNYNPITGKRNSRIFEAVQSLLIWLQPELNQLGLQEFLTPIYVSVFGTDMLVPPCGPADYLLYVYQQKYRENIDKVVHILQSLTQEYCTKPNGLDPIVQTFGQPELPDFESLQDIYASEPDILEDQPVSIDAKLVFGKKGPVLAGQRIPLEVNLKNLTSKMQFLKIHTKLFQGSSVLYSNLNEMSLKSSENSKFSPLTGVPVGTIKGKATCYLQVLISDDTENILTLESPEFEVIGSPEVLVKLVSPPRVGKGHSLKISLVNSTPSIAQNFTLSVSMIVIETCKAFDLVTKPIVIVKTKNISIPLPTPRKGETARIGVSISHKDKVIASQQTENIPISLSPSARRPISSRSPTTRSDPQAASSSSRRVPAPPSSPPPSAPPVRVPSARSSRTKSSSARSSVSSSSRSALKSSSPKSPVKRSSSSRPDNKTSRAPSSSTVPVKPRKRSPSSVSTPKPRKPSSVSTKTAKPQKPSSSTQSKKRSSPSAPPPTPSAKFSAIARVSPSVRSSSTRSSSSPSTQSSKPTRSQSQKNISRSPTTQKSSQPTQSSHSTHSTTSRSVLPSRTPPQSLSTVRSADQKRKIKVSSQDKASDKTKVQKIDVKDHTVSRRRKKR